MRPVPFTVLGGTLLYLVVGASIDSVAPGAHLLGMNLQGLALNTLCLVAALWIGVRLELFD